MPPCKRWMPEDDAILAELWCSGVPAIRIVERFPERTRNAIIGRVHRLRLERSIPDTGTGHARIIPHPVRQIPFRPKVPVVMLEAQPSFFPEEPEGGVTILELKRFHCRSVLDPHGAPNGLALYCGKGVLTGKSFCSYHYAIYYTPYHARRRD